MPLAEEEVVEEGTRHSMHLLWDNHRDYSYVMSIMRGEKGVSIEGTFTFDIRTEGGGGLSEK